MSKVLFKITDYYLYISSVYVKRSTLVNIIIKTKNNQQVLIYILRQT